MGYILRINEEAAKILKKLDPGIQTRISAAIDALATDPRPSGAKKLKGSEFYRIRVGDYRIVYEIRDRQLVVLVIRIGHRKEIYR